MRLLSDAPDMITFMGSRKPFPTKSSMDPPCSAGSAHPRRHCVPRFSSEQSCTCLSTRSDSGVVTRQGSALATCWISFLSMAGTEASATEKNTASRAKHWAAEIMAVPAFRMQSGLPHHPIYVCACINIRGEIGTTHPDFILASRIAVLLTNTQNVNIERTLQESRNHVLSNPYATRSCKLSLR